MITPTAKSLKLLKEDRKTVINKFRDLCQRKMRNEKDKALKDTLNTYYDRIKPITVEASKAA